MRRFGQPHEEGVIVANIDDCAARLICLAEKLVRVNPDLSFAAGIVVNTAIRLAGGEPQAIQTSRSISEQVAVNRSTWYGERPPYLLVILRYGL